MAHESRRLRGAVLAKPMDVARYLNRIEYEGDVSVCLATLVALTGAHLRAVPFENLDIHLRVDRSLEKDWLYDKIVVKNRGGWCYELNLLYMELLKELGFSVDIHGGKVFTEDTDGRDMEHLTLSVTLGSARYLVDVGFGDGMYAPMEIVDGSKSNYGIYRFQIHQRGPQIHLLSFRQGEFSKGLSFDLTPRVVSDFDDAVHFNSSNPASWWTQQLVVSKAIPDGRSTLIGLVSKVRTTTVSKKKTLTRSEYLRTLESEFGIRISYVPRPKASSLFMRFWRLVQIALNKWRRVRTAKISKQDPYQGGE